MNEEIEEVAANTITDIDNMISKIGRIRESYDAAQSGGDSKSLIKSLKKTNVPELRAMFTSLQTNINSLKTIANGSN